MKFILASILAAPVVAAVWHSWLWLLIYPLYFIAYIVLLMIGKWNSTDGQIARGIDPWEDDDNE